MKLLLAEDDLDFGNILSQYLSMSGFEVTLARNGREAWDRFHDSKPDICVLDIMMPEMDGQQALKEMRAMEEARDLSLSRRVKIIMTTALADKENVIEAIRGKCDAFLVKPFQKARLLEELHRLNLIR